MFEHYDKNQAEETLRRLESSGDHIATYSARALRRYIVSLEQQLAAAQEAVRSGDRIAVHLWDRLVDLYRFKAHWTGYALGQEQALVSALFWITDEPHDSIRARAERATTENEEN